MDQFGSSMDPSSLIVQTKDRKDGITARGDAAKYYTNNGTKTGVCLPMNTWNIMHNGRCYANKMHNRFITFFLKINLRV